MNLKQKAWEFKVNLKGNGLKYKDKLAEWQWLNRFQVSELQKERLEALLKHCYNQVPYYRVLLKDSGVIDDDGDVRLEHFHKIKLLDKNEINTNFEMLKSMDITSRSSYTNSSGGSTGVPVQLIQDKEFFEWSLAIKVLDDEWSGMQTVDKRAYVWGSVRDALVGKEAMRTYVGRWIRNEMWLNSFRMTKDRMENFAYKLKEFKPVQILAFAENLYEMAQFIEQRGLSIHPPKSIMTSAGMLYPHMRETIERVFRAPVFNRYGSREVGDIACECDHHKGLHISSFTHYIEVLRPDGTPAEPGEYGEIVVTLLTNYSMPLIRYRIGDMGVMGTENCSCGRGMPLLTDVVGRSSDMFVKKNGDLVDGRMFIRLLMTRPFIQKFQIIQEDYCKIKINMIPAQSTDYPITVNAEDLEQLTVEIKTIMSEECDIEFEFVEEIAATSSGKYRYIISKLHTNK